MSTSSEALKEILEQMPHGRKISKELDELGNMTLVSEHIEENCWRCKLTGALAKEARDAAKEHK